jgi:hypothetical protein
MLGESSAARGISLAFRGLDSARQKRQNHRHFLERFQEKCVAVFRPEPRQINGLEHFGDSRKRENALE